MEIHLHISDELALKAMTLMFAALVIALKKRK